MSLLGKMRLVPYAVLPGVLAFASRWVPIPWFQGACLDGFPVLSSAIGLSTLGGAVVLGGCLAWLGTGRSIRLGSILVAGFAPWFATIGFGLGLWRLLLEAYGRNLAPEKRLTLALELSAELQTRRLTGVLLSASLLLATVLVLGVEARLEHRRSVPEWSRPGRWQPKKAAALVAAALGLCLLAVLDAWMTIEPLGRISNRFPDPGIPPLEQLLSWWHVAHGVYWVGLGGVVLVAATLLVRALLDSRARRPVALRPTLLALCASATLLLDSQLFRQTLPPWP